MKLFKLAVFAVFSLLFAATGFAGDDGLKLTGFVDASYSGNINMGQDNFGFDQVELDIAKEFNEYASFQVDLEWLNGTTAGVEQGYLNYRHPMLEKVTFTLGKFNAPIGFELLDAPDMYQFSHSLVFNNCLPTNLTGLMVSSELAAGFDIKAYAVNGWDQDSEMNGTKTFGGRLGYTRDEMGGLGVSYISGTDDTNQAIVRSVFDVDVTIDLVENLLIGAEFNMGTIDDGTNDFGWTGMLFMGHYDINNWLGLTARYDMVMDSDLYLFNGAGFDEETRSSLTLAPTFILGEGLGALIEYRMDMSSEDVFQDKDGEMNASESTIAFEMTYTF